MANNKRVTFQLDIDAAAVIIGAMSMPLIRQSGNAIGARAQSMAGSISTNPPEITVTTAIGTIKRGQRAIATVSAHSEDAHQNYIGNTALRKAKDAGRVK